MRSGTGARYGESVSISSELGYRGPFDVETGYAGARQLLQRPDPPTVIVCANDVVALGDYEGGTGRKVLGIAFELTRGDAPADRVPPQFARWLPGYLGAER